MKPDIDFHIARDQERKKTLFLESVICMSIGMIARVFYCWKYFVPVRDSYDYEEYIKQWIAYKTIPEDALFPPLGPFILRIPALYFGTDIIKGGIIVNVLLGLCFISVIIMLSREITSSEYAAVCSGLLAATHPTLVYYSCQLLRENTFLLFAGLAALSAIRYIKFKSPNRFLIVFTAFFAVLSCMCRHEGIELIVLFGLLFFLIPRQRKHWGRIRTVSLFVLSCLVSVIITSAAIGISADFYASYPAIFEKYLNPEL